MLVGNSLGCAITEQLIDEVGDHTPYLFTFRRILMWARF